MGGSRSYCAYGLGVLSEIALPGLTPGDAERPVDLRVVRGPVEDPGPDTWSRTSEQRVLLRYPRVGRIEVSGGDRIVVDLATDADLRTLNAVVCGTALGLVMTQRGLHSLHASAIEIGGAAVAFAGNSGDGKSTMLAALQARGHRVLTDDVVAIDDRDGAPRVLPSFPQIKLWPDAAGALGLDVEALPAFMPGHDKRALRFADGLASHAAPLARVYVLRQGSTVRVQELSGREAVLALLTSSFAGLGKANFAEAADFARTAELARAIEVVRLERPWSLTVLPQVVELVEREAGLVEARA